MDITIHIPPLLVYTVGSIFGLLVMSAIVRIIPIKSKFLIEGIFDKIEYTEDLFTGKQLTVYWFHEDCAHCSAEKEKNPDFLSSPYGQCFWSFPREIPLVGRDNNTLAWIMPRKGDTIKLVGKYNIFGELRSYRIYSVASCLPTRF